MKRIVTLFVVSIFLFYASGCSQAKYTKDDIIGLTSKEIIAIYGTFDWSGMPPSQDGLYRQCGGGYVVREAQHGIWAHLCGTNRPLLFIIYFDENGVAYSCDYEKGGFGG